MQGACSHIPGYSIVVNFFCFAWPATIDDSIPMTIEYLWQYLLKFISIFVLIPDIMRCCHSWFSVEFCSIVRLVLFDCVWCFEMDHPHERLPKVHIVNLSVRRNSFPRNSTCFSYSLQMIGLSFLGWKLCICYVCWDGCFIKYVRSLVWLRS